MTTPFTTTITHGAYAVVVQQAIGRRAEFNRGLIMMALGRARDDLKVGLDEAQANAGAASVFGAVILFANAAIHIQELHGMTDAKGKPLAWPAANAKPAAVATAFEFYLDNEELFTLITDAAKALDFPNGPEGAPLEALTEEQAADPN